LFLLAIGAFGWGLSLATYKAVAARNAWPVGALHVDAPVVPILLGSLSLLTAVWFAADRGAALGGWVIVVCGLVLAVFWTGFLRVGSQVSLFLAPAAAALLVVGWLGGAFAFGRGL
jgi:hypothetical protein